METRTEIKRGGLTSKIRPRPVRMVFPMGAEARGTCHGAAEPGTPWAGNTPVVPCCLHCRSYSFAGLAHLQS